MPVVRVTVSLDKSLAEELKRLANKEGVSFSKLVAKSLEEFLIERKKKEAGRKLLEVKLSEEESRLAMEELSRMRREEWRG
ncbi:DUF6364 family protein [Hydrogenivirga sp. 128-5-R1-1]|uniref:ribbon-helix-helix protein, CopG family n=1 Tax=Hydrogenivirga sp. 128-5-R1-1 TaxID=392423 RepID=UPI00015EF190|nr:DUF6364 family protein [Hydrogenivirga sp. 128-5-R1-1]EDP74690.1 hypothetical protein HG1285_14799 [Hydrogenivirga sp. 128-5-R1-1]